MSAHAARSALATKQPPAGTRSFLHIQRHGSGSAAIYILNYHRLEHRMGARPKPVLVEGPQSLIELLERLGVDFRRDEVRGALEDILRLGSANIPDLWLNDQETIERGLSES